MNVVLFNPDEWRGDAAGCYGHPVVRTPHLDRLAAQGVRFDQCHAQHPVCSPSRAAFMTGWYPHVRGHRTLWHLLRPDEPNLLRYLTRAGYDVRWYGKNDLLAPECFPGSVTEAGSYLGPGRPPPRGPEPSALTGTQHAVPRRVNPWARDDPRYMSFLFEPAGPAREHPDYGNLELGLRFLREPHDRPFCLYLPLVSPHPPYSAPDPFHDRYDPAVLPPLRPPGGDKPRFYEAIRRSRRLDELDDGFLRTLHAVYLGMVSFSDWLLGELLRTLDETGLAENTAVFVFSDHGDWAGDYGLVEKWPSALDDAITRVPFVVRAPGGAAGHVVREVVELFDLAPTVLEMAGIAPEHTVQARSLLAQIGGAPGDPGRAAFAEGGYDPHEPHCFEGHVGDHQVLQDAANIYHPKVALQQLDPLSVCRAAMVRTATHKLIRRPLDVSELYDLRTDPAELRNVHDDPAHADARRALESRLLDWYVRTSDVTPLDESPRGYVRPWVGAAHG